MKIKSLSASALLVADACMARYVAEYHDRAARLSGKAADIGTAVHGALEVYVQAVYIDKKADASIKLLEDLYKISYMQTFDTADLDTAEFADGWQMVMKWHARTPFDGFQVLSVETKETFDIKTSAGLIPFNYIWDRADQLEENVYRIVDYKTVRMPIRSSDLKNKIQARCYALAGQIKWPNAERIWVTFDLLRHESVGRVFTRDDNIATWKFLKESAEKILAADTIDPPEKLNAECKWCVRKTACVTLNSNIAVGGIMSLNGKQAADRLASVVAQLGGLKQLQSELEEQVLKYAEKEDVTEFETDDYVVEMGITSRRNIDSQRAAKVVGPDIIARIGKIGVTDVDKLLKGDELTPEQKRDLKSLIYRKTGDPTPIVKPKNPIDE